MTKIYLAHKYEKQKEGLVFQRALEAQGWEVLNPFAQHMQIELEAATAIKENNGFISDGLAARVVAADLDLIDEADHVFAIISPNAIGTISEIFYAGYISGMPVIALFDYDIPYRHPFISQSCLSGGMFYKGEGDKALVCAENLLSVHAYCSTEGGHAI